jgi:hypothetical protein
MYKCEPLLLLDVGRDLDRLRSSSAKLLESWLSLRAQFPFDRSKWDVTVV